MDIFGNSDDEDDGPTETQQRVETVVDALRAEQIQLSEVVQRLDGSIEEHPVAARVLLQVALHNSNAVEGIVEGVIDRLAERELARPVAENLLVSTESLRTNGIDYPTVAEGSLDALEEALRRIETVRTGRSEEVLGGGASEIVLATELRGHADSVGGRKQLVTEATADAFEAVPRALAQQANMDPIDTLVEMRSKYGAGDTVGINTEEGEFRNGGELAIDEMELRTRLTDGVALAGIVALTQGTVTQLGTLTGHDPNLDGSDTVGN